MADAQRRTDSRDASFKTAEMKAQERKLNMRCAMELKMQAKKQAEQDQAQEQQMEMEPEIEPEIPSNQNQQVPNANACQQKTTKKRKQRPLPSSPDLINDTKSKPLSNDVIEQEDIKRSKTEHKSTKEGAVKLSKPKIVYNPDKPIAARMTKYKLRPTNEQMQLLKQVLGVTTWTYNQSLLAVREQRAQPVIKSLRDTILNSKAPLLSDKPWVTAVPYDLRDEAAKDFAQAWKANETKKKKGDVYAVHAAFRFQHKFRKSRKIVIHAKHYWGAGIFHPAFFGKQPFRCGEQLPERLMYDATLTVNWLGEVHLYIPAPLDPHSMVGDQPVAPNPIAAIDPGVRTPGTVYDPTNQQYIEWGGNDIGHIYRLAHHMDDLQSRMCSTPEKPIGHHTRWRMKRAWRRMSKRVQNLVKDFHYKFAKWLCLNYQVILLPTYDTRQMIRRGQRRIRSKTVRATVTWSSATFRDRLIGMSRRYPGCHIVQLSEAYTSKTCRSCGFLHNKLGGNKVFKCPSCQARYPRDDGGASNIFLRHLTMIQLDKEALNSAKENAVSLPCSEEEECVLLTDMDIDVDATMSQEYLSLTAPGLISEDLASEREPLDPFAD